MPSDLCPKCGLPPIEGCRGTGVFVVNETTVRPCQNLYVKRLKEHLGAEIGSGKHVRGSPLLQLNPEGGSPLVDLTTQNLIIQATWRALKPHLKWTLSFKGLMFRFLVITDERIKGVFLGAEAYAAKSKDVRNDAPSFNSLSDLLGDGVDLAIIRVGFLGYKNRAAAGALKEILLHRESLPRPTWVIVDPERPWVHSHDLDLQEYLDAKNYTPIFLEGPSGSPSLGIQVDEGDEEAVLAALMSETKVPIFATVTTPSSVTIDEDEFKLPGSDRKKKGWAR